MRWLKWSLVACWLGVHALLWTLLPAIPFALNGRVPCVLPLTFPPRYYSADSTPWYRSDAVSSLYYNFAFVEGRPQLVVGDATSVHIYDPATRQVQTACGVPSRVWGLSADGTYAVVNNGPGLVWLMNLASGVRTKIADGWVHFRARFANDPDRRLFRRERLLLLNGSTLFIVEPGVEGETTVHLTYTSEVMAVAPDGRTAAVGVSNIFDGSHWGNLELGFELIDVPAGKKINSDDLHLRGRWLSCRISPDGRTVAGSITVWQPFKPGMKKVEEHPRLMTWELPTGRRLRTVENAWGCGWCADGRLVVRNEDGDCYFADAELNQQGDVPIPSRLTNMDDLSADEAGTHLIVKHVRPIREPLRSVKNWLKSGSGESFTAEWECFDLDGRTIAAVPGLAGGCDISRDGKYFAVGSPDGKAVDIYDLPRKNPGGIVLGLMIAEVALAILWTVGRRRRARRLRCAAA